MDDLSDYLQQCSEDGRDSFLAEMLRAIAEIGHNLERDVAEAEENRERAIWLKNIGCSGEDGAIDLYTHILNEVESKRMKFLLFLRDFTKLPHAIIDEHFEWKAAGERVEAALKVITPGAQLISPAQRTGGRPAKSRQKIIERMHADVRNGALTEERLKGMRPTDLELAYKAHHETVKAARKEVLQGLADARNAERGTPRFRVSAGKNST